MLLLSLKFSSPSFHCSISPHTRAPNKAASIPVSTKKHLPTFSLKFVRNGNWVSLRNRFHAKSADPDTDGNSQSSVAVSGDGGSSSSSATSFLSILCPLLKLFSGGDPSQERNYSLEVATSSLSTLARFPWGSKSLSENERLNNQEAILNPLQYLQLFEFEACPFCRRVREAMTELDLSAEVYPCPKGSLRHREIVRKSGGKEQFPYLVDPNTGISMYESGDIVKYLFEQYGKGRTPSMGLLESTFFTGWMPTILRAGRGMTLWEKARLDPPSKKLELFSYENNPYARIVREALCELELPYILQNVGAGSQRTKLLLDASGSQESDGDTYDRSPCSQAFSRKKKPCIPSVCALSRKKTIIEYKSPEVPYLIDPNTGAEMGDYRKILAYLFQTYSATPDPQLSAS